MFLETCLVQAGATSLRPEMPTLLNHPDLLGLIFDTMQNVRPLLSPPFLMGSLDTPTNGAVGGGEGMDLYCLPPQTFLTHLCVVTEIWLLNWPLPETADVVPPPAFLPNVTISCHCFPKGLGSN